MHFLTTILVYSSLATGTLLILASVRFVALFLRTAECFLNDDGDGDGSEKVTNKVYSRTSANGHLSTTATHFFVPADKKPIHWLLFKTSLRRPPLYNGHFFVSQGGLCRNIQLYVRFFKLHLFFSNFSSTWILRDRARFFKALVALFVVVAFLLHHLVSCSSFTSKLQLLSF